MSGLQSYFYDLADYARELLAPGQELALRLAAEDSSFIRLHRSQVRQAGRVSQRYLTLELLEGKRHGVEVTTVAGGVGSDRVVLRDALERLTARIATLPEDDLVPPVPGGRSTEHRGENRLPPRETMLGDLLEAGRGLDLTGIHASGSQEKGFAHSSGPRHWFSRHSFCVDGSLCLENGRAVKVQYAGEEWSPEELARRARTGAEQLEVLRREPVSLEPGSYRVYLAPTALDALLKRMASRNFGLRSQRTGASAILRMVEEGATLHPSVHLWEAPGGGRAPGFNASGFPKPEKLSLVEDGHFRGSLVSPRSAVEYGIDANGAEESETPLALEMAGGDLPEADILSRLGDGLHLGHLHYLNVSDRRQAGFTGVTRFACFQVEGGRITRPISTLRFDDSLYRILGSELVGLTRERQWIPEAGTYGARSFASALLPGALVKDLRFAL